MTEDARPTKDAGPTEDAGQKASQTRPFALLLLAGFGVTGLLALVLLLVFAALGLAGAPYWAVAVAVIGGIVMRRVLLRDPGMLQVVLFTACSIGGALAGLWLGDVLLT